MPLLLVTVGLFGLQQYLLRGKGYVALTGKGGERRLIDLGRWRWLLLAYSGLVLTCSLVLPYLVLLQAAFAKAWAQGLSWNNLTLANFQFLLFQHSTAKSAILNTIVYSSAAATLALGLAIAIAYMVNRRLVPFGNALSVLAFAPFVIPGMVLAIGFYAPTRHHPWRWRAPRRSSCSRLSRASSRSPTPTRRRQSVASTPRWRRP